MFLLYNIITLQLLKISGNTIDNNISFTVFQTLFTRTALFTHFQ